LGIFAGAANISDWRPYVADFIKRIKRDPEGVTGAVPVDSEFAARYAAVHEHLTCDWLEGAARRTSSLTVFVDGGRWKGCLSDRENGLVLFVAADGFGGVLDTLERQIRDGTGDWREQRDYKPGRRKS